jgi:hypothetical protein
VAYDIGEWSEFATAHVGASAALLGLVFVGLTINLRDVIASRQLVNRVAEAVVLLEACSPARLALALPALFAIAGLTLAATAGGGLYWWPAAVLVSYFGALTNAWILLIGILR